MPGVVKKLHFFIDIDFALFCLFLTMLLQWIVLQEVAGFLVKPFHIGMIFLFVSVLFDKNLLTYASGLFRVGYYFFVLVLLFVLVEILSLFWTKRLGAGMSGIVRQSLYIFMGFSLSIKMANIHTDKTIKTVFLGCLFGVIVFFSLLLPI
jgi:hypothetical protein